MTAPETLTRQVLVDRAISDQVEPPEPRICVLRQTPGAGPALLSAPDTLWSPRRSWRSWPTKPACLKLLLWVGQRRQQVPDPIVVEADPLRAKPAGLALQCRRG